MIEGLKPYSEYKDSGLPWLGNIPAHWNTRRMKFLFQERVQKGFANEPLLAATQTKGVVRKEDYGSRTVTAQKDFHLLKLVEIGDFVISLRSFEGGIEVAHCRGIISPAYTILKPRPESESGYFRHFFKSRTFISSLTLFVTGIREGQNIDYERLSRSYMALPPREEQDAIVRFLDHANGRIERFIRTKKKLIALLNEQKQAIIHRAVTRGLDPNVRLKPSAVSWLGDIPEHWMVVPSKSLFTHRKKKASVEDPILTASQAHGIIRRDEFMENEGRRVMQVITGYGILKRVEANDFVISMRSFQGGLEWSKISGAVSSAYVTLVPQNEVHPPYFAYLLKCKAYVTALRRTSDLVRDGQALRYANFGQVPLPLIPISEQQKIALHLDIAVADVNTIIVRTEREIALMREYRTRLVSDVVTGQLDVREAAKHLPAEVEAEPILDGDELMEDIELDGDESEAE